MNRTLKQLVKISPFQRNYAIMTRAKQRAGIALTTSTPKIAAKVKPKAEPKQVQPPTLNIRKPAGIEERLVKVNTNITQPEHPHMIKVAVIGAANAGKSTLVNKIVGEEVSGVSPKAHTTRERILAILSEKNHQVVFLDTPGVIPHHNHAKMNRTLATSSWRSLDEADHILVMVDAARCLDPKARITQDFITSKLQDAKIPATLVFNKMDKIDDKKEVLEHIREEFLDAYPHFQETLYVSAVYEQGLDKVKNLLFDASPAKPWEYASDQKTEMPDLKRVEDLIRVEFFKRLHQYIPYMLKQENVGWTELENGTLRIDQNVYVQRESQQRIVVGHKGKIIDSVVQEAREKISEALKRPVKLFIQVKHRKNVTTAS